jgi:hypothetical protein
MATRPKPARVISMTAKNRRSGDLEHYRIRDPRMSREDAIAIFGMFLGSLGWKPHEVMICHAKAETEDIVTMAIRNRMIQPGVRP